MTKPALSHWIKKFILISIFSLFQAHVQAQQSEMDSLKAIISKNKKNSETVDALTSVGTLYSLTDINKSNIYLKSAVRIGQQINEPEGVAWAEELLAINQSYIGNYSKAIEMLLKTLKTGEQLKKIPLQRACLLDLCYIYDDLEDYSKGFYYSDKAYHISKSKIIKSSCLHINGYFLCKMNRPDKALPYFEKELNIAKNLSKKEGISMKNQKLGYAYTGFGMAYSYQGNYENALLFFRKGEAYLLKGDYDVPLIENYYYTALTYKKMKEKDSSIFYYKMALEQSVKINYVKGKLDCYKELANLNSEANPVMAVHYFKLTQKLNDSLFNYKKKSEIQALTLNEEERQEEIIKKQKEEAEIRKQNIQYALIALGLVTFVIFILIFSRGLIKSTKVIKFFGIIALLILFEFINLLIHPFLEKITHHSPILMLLALVSIAFLIVPLHHKLEKWAVEKLIERNKISRSKTSQGLDTSVNN